MAQLTDLPPELIVDIMAQVGDTSYKDLFNLKQCSKALRTLAEESYIYRRVSLNNLPIIQWKNQETALSFITKCIESKNPEALYRQGVIEFFSSKMYESGLDYLRAATREGHLGARYVLAMIFICNGDDQELEKQGLELLGRVCRVKKEIECRKMFLGTVSVFWPNLDDWFLLSKPDVRCSKRHRKMKTGWSGEYEYFEDERCEACRLEVEIDRFYDHFDWRRYPRLN